MAVDPNSLVTLQEVKDYLGIPVSNTGPDALLETLINASSKKIESYIDRKIKRQSYIETQDGAGTDRIVTRHWPVLSVSEIAVDTSSEFTDANVVTEFLLEGDPAIGIILKGGRRFPKGTQCIRVTYEAGYDDVPYDLKQACLFTVEFMYEVRSDRTIRTTSKSKSGESVSYAGDIPQFVKDMIEPYSRCEFALGSISIQSV